MAPKFCDHLGDYAVQYTETEACYRQCVNLLDTLLAEGPRPDVVKLTTAALEAWTVADGKLRDLLVAEVKVGRVRIPAGILTDDQSGGRERRQALANGHPVCAQCRFVVPRLAYPEWKFAHNGTPTFRGMDFPLLVATPA